jgi:hypothetical protein
MTAMLAAEALDHGGEAHRVGITTLCSRYCRQRVE